MWYRKLYIVFTGAPKSRHISGQLLYRSLFGMASSVQGKGCRQPYLLIVVRNLDTLTMRMWLLGNPCGHTGYLWQKSVWGWVG